MRPPFYITTPIYYVNDRPHIGHAYSTIAADVLARYQRLRGAPTRFLTGLDEHGLKIERAAKEKGFDSPQAFTDSMAAPFRDAWKILHCEHDDFIRTTEPRHKDRVARLWKRLVDAGDVYLGHYEDWYCVGCEGFKTEKELLPGNLCPDHKRPVEKIKEETYFFRLSKYEKPLLELYEKHPTFVQPEGRLNEVKSFVSQGLKDLSISRTTFSWGVPVPGDPKHVVYVWLDALTNYMSALGGPAERGEAPDYDRFWSDAGRIVHIVGKDILRFHAIFWPAFLMSAGLPHEKITVMAHGWLTVNGEKMSKSLGNFLAPGPLVDAFGADVLRYHLMREVGFGQDGDFSHAHLIARYHGELANGLGNLLNRILGGFVDKHFGGIVPEIPRDPTTGHTYPMRSDWTDDDRALIDKADLTADRAAARFEELQPHRALEAIWELVSEANRYVDTTAPWALAKAGDRARLAQVCYVVLHVLRRLSVLLWPVMPEKAEELRGQLGLGTIETAERTDLWSARDFGTLRAGTKTALGTPLFPKIDDDRAAELIASLAPKAHTEPAAKAVSKPKDEPVTEATDAPKTIAFDDFLAVDLRVGLVREAEKVPKSKKLVRLQIDLGDASPRQVLAGIAEHYDPAALVGKRVVVVANLAPRAIMGVESHGMCLAATDANGLGLLTVDKEVAPGTRVS